MPDTYNIYCDESTHLLNDRAPFMVLGAIWCPADRAREIAIRVREIKAEHNLSPQFEIKWTKVSKAKIRFYLDVLDYFFDNADLHFRGVVAPKGPLDYERFGLTHDDVYYRMYFYLLQRLLRPSARFRVYLDIKDTRSRAKVATLRDVLANNMYDFDRQIVERGDCRTYVAASESCGLKRSSACQQPRMLSRGGQTGTATVARCWQWRISATSWFCGHAPDTVFSTPHTQWNTKTGEESLETNTSRRRNADAAALRRRHRYSCHTWWMSYLYFTASHDPTATQSGRSCQRPLSTDLSTNNGSQTPTVRTTDEVFQRGDHHVASIGHKWQQATVHVEVARSPACTA